MSRFREGELQCVHSRSPWLSKLSKEDHCPLIIGSRAPILPSSWGDSLHPWQLTWPPIPQPCRLLPGRGDAPPPPPLPAVGQAVFAGCARQCLLGVPSWVCVSVSDTGAQTQDVCCHLLDMANKSFTRAGKLNIEAAPPMAGVEAASCRRVGRAQEVSFPFLYSRKGKYRAGPAQSFIPQLSILALNVFCQASLQYRLK